VTYIVTMARTCIISETQRDVGLKSRYFHTPLRSKPHYGGLRQNITIMFGIEKLERWNYLTAKKLRNRYVQRC